MSDFPALAELDGATPGAAADSQPAAASPAPPILEWLESEGFRAHVDDDGDIHLRHEGRDIFIVFDAEDPAYIRVIAPAFWRCDNDAEQRFLALTVANRLNGALKVAKISCAPTARPTLPSSSSWTASRLSARCSPAASTSSGRPPGSSGSG
ncbi:MAG: hypothetical protein IPF66_25210 [Holophagales bacterium]|nr:hypothetical protein [Holophagales bacterium]